jgi:hypothetical protein
MPDKQTEENMFTTHTRNISRFRKKAKGGRTLEAGSLHAFGKFPLYSLTVNIVEKYLASEGIGDDVSPKQ